MKYQEEETIKQLTEYIESTYEQHYANKKLSRPYEVKEENLQAMDIFRSLNIPQDFCHANALKYLLRYGKKDGHNTQDLYKAMHYIILLISNK